MFDLFKKPKISKTIQILKMSKQQDSEPSAASAAMYASFSSMLSLVGKIYDSVNQPQEQVFGLTAPAPLPHRISPPKYLQKGEVFFDDFFEDVDSVSSDEHVCGICCKRKNILELSIGNVLGAAITPEQETDSSSIVWLKERELKQLPNQLQTEYVSFVQRFSDFYSRIFDSRMDPATMSFVLKSFIDSEEPFLRQMFTDYDKAIKSDLYSKIELDSMSKAFSSPEVREMYERIMRRSAPGDNNSDSFHSGVSTSTSSASIPNGLSKEEMKVRLSEKYSYENLAKCDIVSPTIQQHTWGEIEHVFYEKTKIALNGGKSGRITKTFCDNLSSVFWTLVDAEAIDMTERNFSLLLYRFGGINYGREDNDQYIHWHLEKTDLTCFLKYTVIDGGKYSWASKFFKIGEQEYITDKQSSVYAEKSPLRLSMYELGIRIGTCKPRSDD